MIENQYSDARCLAPGLVDQISLSFGEAVQIIDSGQLGTDPASQRIRDVSYGIHIAAEMFRLRRGLNEIPLPIEGEIVLNLKLVPDALLVPHEAHPSSPLDGLEGDAL